MVDMGLLIQLIIGVLAFLSSIFYLVSSVSLFRLYLEVGGEFWVRLSVGFAFLSLSQVSMVFSIVVRDAGISYALYTTSPALAISGIYMVWSSRRFTQFLAVTPLALAPSALDIIAFSLAVLVALGSRRHVRVGFLLIALAHLGRAIGTLALPGLAPALVIIVSEILRALGALYMAFWYARRVI